MSPPVLSALWVVVQAAVTFRPEDDGYPGSVHASRYVREQLPDDAVLAMGDLLEVTARQAEAFTSG